MADNKKWSEQTLITSIDSTTEFCVLHGTNPVDNRRINAATLLATKAPINNPGGGQNNYAPIGYPIFTGEFKHTYNTPVGYENSDIIFSVYNTAINETVFAINDWGNMQCNRNAYFYGDEVNMSQVGEVTAPIVSDLSDYSNKVATTSFVQQNLAKATLKKLYVNNTEDIQYLNGTVNTTGCDYAYGYRSGIGTRYVYISINNNWVIMGSTPYEYSTLEGILFYNEISGGVSLSVILDGYKYSTTLTF